MGAHPLQIAAPGLAVDDVVLHRLGEQAQRGDRRAEVVRNRREQIAPGRLGMVAAGLFIMGRGILPDFHLPGWAPGPSGDAPPRELKPWMPAVHGFIAGWGLDAFSVIIYTTLAPAMPSAATGWLPGFVFGLGTLCVQGAAGAAFGAWAARRGLPPEAIRSIALTTAARTLAWGGGAFILFGLFALAFPDAANVEIATPLHVHNLDTLGLPFVLVVFTVFGVGVTSFVTATQAWRRRHSIENGAPATLKP